MLAAASLPETVPIALRIAPLVNLWAMSAASSAGPTDSKSWPRDTRDS